MRAIFTRELQSYFYTAAAYVFMGVFLALGSVFFAINNLAARSGDLLSLLWQMSYVWLLLAPVLTMRSFAGEKKQRTDQLLYTSPISLTSVVLGKFFAACVVLLFTVGVSLIYPLIIALYGRVYMGEMLAGYLGFILHGCLFIALDMYISARAQSPMTAALLAVGANMLLWLADVLNAAVKLDAVNAVLGFISPYIRFEPFSLGQISYASIAYYVLFMAALLFFTVQKLSERRWSE